MPLTWGKRLLPLVATQIYMTGTVLLFAFGPWEWPTRHPEQLYGFLIAVQAALIVGYLSAAHKAPTEPVRSSDPRRLILFCLIAMAAITPFLSYAKTGHWIPNIGEALSNPGKVYAESLEVRRKGVNFGALVTDVLGPWLMALFPLVIFYWRRIQGTMRVAAVILLICMLLMSIATGQRRDIADQMVTLPFILLASHWAGVTRLSRKVIMTMTSGLAAFTIVFVVYFTYSNMSRIGDVAAGAGINPITHQGANWDHPLLAQTPPEIRPAVFAISDYLTTGYYGCSLAMDRDWKPMYGVGNSMFLTYVAGKLTNDQTLLDRSYAVQIDYSDGFTYPVHWCTAYPYLANDVSFPGVVLLMILVGRLFAATWVDACGGKNPHAVVLFALTALMVIYLPATNRMLQDGDGISAFLGWLVIWLAYRKTRKPALPGAAA